MIRVFYSPAYCKSEHAFDTTRKSRWIAESLSESPIASLQLTAPEPLSEEPIAAVHDVDYLRAVQTGDPRELAESQGFRWDAGLWPMVAASNGGVVSAVFAALKDGVSGSLSSGLHHARRAKGAGFCTFNGLVIAAHAALDAGMKSVLILDLDAHCGGGTASLIADEPRIWQIDVSVNGYDSYQGSDRVHLDIVEHSGDYLPTIEQRLTDADQRALPFDLCLYNAGMDPSEDCSTGGLPGITQELLAQRDSLVFEWCRTRKLPIAFVLAGGYVGARLDQRNLVELHRLTLSSAAAAARQGAEAE